MFPTENSKEANLAEKERKIRRIAIPAPQDNIIQDLPSACLQVSLHSILKQRKQVDIVSRHM
jgi:hypothetical protein